MAPVNMTMASTSSTRSTQPVLTVMLLASWGLLDLGATSLAALIAGIIVLDLGSQALHISNQAAIYPIRPQPRTQINTAYLVSNIPYGAPPSPAPSVPST